MISKNGMKFRFSAGEKVLCYEPDPTKAKVLYDSKVLELCISKDKRRKVPEYLIHFSGWSSSWDRCVTEEFILKDTTENRHLQRKLAEAAVVQIKSKKQKRKLSVILKDSYRYGKKGGLSSDDDTDDSKNTDDSESDSSYQSASGSEGEEEPDEEPAVLNLKLSEVLKKKLDEDYSQIKQKNKLVKLPCEPTVINILEGYVKTYATNELCLTSDSRRCIKKETDIETNISLCKEVMDGLRIYFDFTLSLLLLYNEEKEQYNFYVNNYVPSCIDQVETSDKVTPVHAPLEVKIEQDVSKGSMSDSASSHQAEAGCLSPTLRSRKSRGDLALQLSPQPSKSPRSPIQKQFKRELPDDLETELPKRVLRSTAVKQEVNAHRLQTLSPTTVDSGALTHSDGSCGATQPEEAVKESKFFKLGTRSQPHRQAAAIAEALILKSCNSTRSGPSSPLPAAMVSSIAHSTNNEASPIGKASASTSVPALVATRTHLSSISSCSSKSGPSSPTSGVASNSAQKMTNALNEAIQWRMIPSYVYKQQPVAPSLIYGAQHLLRLFVKLPEMINKTNMPANKLQVLETHLESFLSYLTQRQEDFFSANAYTDFTETFRIPNSTSSPDSEITDNAN